jgi:cytochrome oxidase assembly protein ShyY1
MRIRFRFRTIPFIATVLLVALGIALGNWQARRAASKGALQAQLTQRAAEPPLVLGPALTAPAELEYRRVTVTGEFVRDWPVFLDNRPNAGRAGFYLVMPFKIAGSHTHVLVVRGWLARDPREYGRVPAFPTPSGQVTIEGRVKASAGHVMQLGEPAPLKPGALVQNVEVAQFAQASGLRLQPFFVEQLAARQAAARAPGDPLVRDWPAPALGIDKHRGYAFQWYALAAMAGLFFVITGFRSGTKQVD